MTDYEISLVSSAKCADGRAYEELYSLYYSKVFALARATVKNEADAEDILQEAFINAWRYLGSLADPSAFNTWLQKITLNLCHSLLRKKNIAILLDLDDDADDFGFKDIESDELLPAVYAERDDLRYSLGKIIDSLSEVQKQTIILYYFNELKVEEIAYVMECSEGTVKTRLYLARKAIRTEVEEQERASGQKFYGVAGIAMLGLGRLLAQQIEMQAISPAAYYGIMQSISQTIVQGGAGASYAHGGNHPVATRHPSKEGNLSSASGQPYALNQSSAPQFNSYAAGVDGNLPAVGSAAGYGVAHTSGSAPGYGAAPTAGSVAVKSAAGVATKAGMSLATKIIAGVAAAAIVAGGGYGIWQATRGDNPQPPEPSPIASGSPASEKPAPPNGPAVSIPSIGEYVLEGEYYAPEDGFHDGLALLGKYTGSGYFDIQWGFVDTFGRVVIPFEYDDAQSFSEGYARVGNYDDEGYMRYGLFDASGRVVLPLEYYGIDAYNTEYFVLENDAFKQGIADASGSIVSPFVYDSIGDFTYEGYSNGDLIYVETNGKIGLIDKSTFMVILQPEYDRIEAISDEFFETRIDEFCGMVDRAGNVVAPFEYDMIFSFDDEGLARVQRDGKRGFIDTSGRIVIPLEFDYADAFSEGLAAVRLGEKSGYIDPSGNVAIPFEFTWTSDFNNGIAHVGIGEGTGIIDKSGRLVIPDLYESIGYFCDEGLAPTKRDDKWGYTDHFGRVVIPFEYSDASSFFGGLAIVRNGWEVGVIDTTGRIVVPIEYNYVRILGNDDLSYYPESVAAVYKNLIEVSTADGNRGYYDIGGAIVVPPEYGRVECFSDGRYLVANYDDSVYTYLWGIFDAVSGSIALPMEYNEISVFGEVGGMLPSGYQGIGAFDEGLALVRKDRKYGYIDTYGRIVVPVEYGMARVFSEGFAAVMTGDMQSYGQTTDAGVSGSEATYGKWGFIDAAGKIVVPLEYDWVSDFREGYALAGKDGKVYILRNF